MIVVGITIAHAREFVIENRAAASRSISAIRQSLQTHAPASSRAVLNASVRSVNRILVVGCPGSGKTTFAQALVSITGLPLHRLDDYYWHPGWTRPSADEWLATIQALIANDRWILDGNYQDSLPLRLTRADVAVFLDLPTSVCLWRAARRGVWRALGDLHSLPARVQQETPRLGLSFDWRFVDKVLRFRRRERPALLRLFGQHGADCRVVRIRSRREASEFLSLCPTLR
jgi:adenylate kinase family enzyme